MTTHDSARAALRKAVATNVTEAVDLDPRDQFEIAAAAWPECEDAKIKDPVERRRKHRRVANKRMQLAKRGKVTLDALASLGVALGLPPHELLWIPEDAGEPQVPACKLCGAALPLVDGSTQAVCGDCLGDDAHVTDVSAK